MDDSTESPASEAASGAGEFQSAEKPPAGTVNFALAGLQAGMLGVFGLLAWVGVSAALERRGFWSEENLFASLFYGSDALRAGFGSKTFSGLATYLIVYSALGALFGMAVRVRLGPLRTLLAAVLFALAWFYVSFHLIWKSVIPLAYLLYADRPMLMGHLIYGAWLARFPAYLPGNRSRTLPAETAELPPVERPMESIPLQPAPALAEMPAEPPEPATQEPSRGEIAQPERN